ncbi:pyruvate kinase [Zhongshania antarctica]|uniref:Pyruvate kinase n=1 Tax=Zhongshania antarctica TaxID=641702 RepID=A0A840QZV4_9GAMM|nr:pyruvate kinase [Zhongshania antarctica]MBB5186265.1 pyruvate kinase [Zhongshania antarctica]
MVNIEIDVGLHRGGVESTAVQLTTDVDQKKVPALAKQHRRSVAVLGDLQGPKVRISRFAAGPVELENGQLFMLDANLSSDGGSSGDWVIFSNGDYSNVHDDTSTIKIVNVGDSLG